MIIEPQPIFVPWIALCLAMEPLHQGDRGMVDELHDIWKAGAPHPSSFVRDPTHFDERIYNPAAGDVRRLLIVDKLARWIVDASIRRGYPYTLAQAYRLLHGVADPRG